MAQQTLRQYLRARGDPRKGIGSETKGSEVNKESIVNWVTTGNSGEQCRPAQLS